MSLASVLQRSRRQLAHTRLSFWAYRYRYLAAFTVIGFLSILLEVSLIKLMPEGWPWPLRSGLGFVAGLAFSFGCNARFNFRVPRPHMVRTFGRFALVSGLSFALNMAAVSGLRLWLDESYAVSRFASAAVLFLVAYSLHRRYTFDLARNFGVAVYASPAERVANIFRKIGRNCDHVHIDLVDETMNPAAAPVNLRKIAVARRFWPGIPVCLHVMSETPGKWVERTWHLADWFLFHLSAREDLHELVMRCRVRGKKVGVVWHVTNPLSDLMPFLPHVDFVMVLGIAHPGRSGQKLLEEAVAVAATLDDLRSRYGYRVMFDGGVNADTVHRIRAKYIVAASAVLRSDNPVRTSHTLRTGALYERRAA